MKAKQEKGEYYKRAGTYIMAGYRVQPKSHKK